MKFFLRSLIQWFAWGSGGTWPRRERPCYQKCRSPGPVSCPHSWGMPPRPDYSSDYDAGDGRRNDAAGRGLPASWGYQVSSGWVWGRPWRLFPNDEVQWNNKDDEGDSCREPPVVFSRKINARAVNLDDGDGSVVNLNCCDGKKCRDRDDSGTEEVGFDFKFHLTEDSRGRGRDAPVILLICWSKCEWFYSNSRFVIWIWDISRIIMRGSSLAGHEPISMDVEIGEWATNPRQPMVWVERVLSVLLCKLAEIQFLPVQLSPL